MALQEKELMWLAEFTGKKEWLTNNDVAVGIDKELQIKNAVEAKERDKLREGRLLIIRNKVSRITTNLKVTFNKELKAAKDKAFMVNEQAQATIKMIGEGNEAEFDFYEDISQVDPEILIRYEHLFSRATMELIILEDELAAGTYSWSINEGGAIATKEYKLFQEHKDPTSTTFFEGVVAQNIYSPLVRQKAFPETLIKSEFSEVQKMIDATNSMYLEELAEVEESSVENFLKNSKLVLETINTIAGSAAEISFLSGKVSQDDRDLVKAAFELGTTGLQTTMETMNAFSKGDIRGGLQQAFSNMASSIGGFIGTSTGDNKLGKYFELSIAAGGVALDIDPTRSVAENIENTFRNATILAFNFSINANDDTTKETLEYIRNSIKIAFQTKDFLAGVKRYADGIGEELDWKEVLVLILKGSEVALNGAISIEALKQIQEKRKEKKELGEIESPTAEQTSDLEELNDELDELSELKTGIDNKLLEEAFKRAAPAKKKLADSLKDSMEEQLKEQQGAFSEALEVLYSSEASGEEAELKSIAQLTAKLKQDQAIWDKVFMLASKGASLGKLLAEVMGPGPAIMELIKTITAAYIRRKEFETWRQTQEDVSNIKNPYYSSITNFVNNQDSQKWHEYRKAFFLVIKVAGEIAALTPASTVGKIISASAEIALSTEELIYEVVEKVKLAEAWKVTQKALKNPHYRRLNVYVRELNPTLAKYTIAYGAVVAKSPIAIHAMNAIGLDDDILSRRNAKASDVKKYLEQRYRNDGEVKHYYKPETKWVLTLPDVDLDSKRFLQIINFAFQSDSKITSNHASILPALNNAHTKEEDFYKLPNITTCTAFIDALKALRILFSEYAPTNGEGGVCDSIKMCSEEYIGYIDAELSNLKEEKERLEEFENIEAS